MMTKHTMQVKQVSQKDKKDKNLFYQKIKEAALVTAGKIDNFNSMTIGWATYGILWSKKVIIVYVKPCRYTYEFLNNNDYFTVSFFDKAYNKELMYFGKYSGRDFDKVKDTGFNPININDVSVSYKEAKETILAKKIYFQDLDLNQIPKDIIDKYYKEEAPHRIYVGEIIEEINND